MTWKSSTLNDLESYWQAVQSATLATGELLVFIKSSGQEQIQDKVLRFYLRNKRVIFLHSVIYPKSALFGGHVIRKNKKRQMIQLFPEFWVRNKKMATSSAKPFQTVSLNQDSANKITNN